MELSPNTIYKEYINNKLSKDTAINLLASILENYDNDKIREESIKVLGNKEFVNENLYDLFESLLTSDSSEIIRNAAAIYLCEHHINKSLAIFKWTIRHEKSFQCLLTVVKALVKIDSKESRAELIDQLKKIRKLQYINAEKGYENRKYKEALKPLIKRNKINAYSNKQLGDILINFFTIRQLIKEFPNVYFELNSEDVLINGLDLSDYLEFEVKGTPWGWKNNIDSVSKIIGLKNLQNLQNLNLANNQIHDLKALVEMKSLTHLDLSNNKLSDPQNIEYLKQIPLLELIDLRGNDLANYIQSTDFSPNTRILKENSLIDLEERLDKRFGTNG
ncbi:MAG: hypothetical protein EAX91_05415 [Candidatus Lokiarchaeota archaeon]|nr:hypothetical protein [Candidatus Lokiarchaeota archaeon]